MARKYALLANLRPNWLLEMVAIMPIWSRFDQSNAAG
jgi:hypothetical protein